MNIAHDLPEPLNSFVVDVPAHTYYDFELGLNSTYPLAGVTYPVDYGNIPGYIGEDGDELDLFVGNSKNGLNGAIVVYRGQAIPKEHKFYTAISADELTLILKELKPVLLDHQSLDGVSELLKEVIVFKDQNNAT